MTTFGGVQKYPKNDPFLTPKNPQKSTFDPPYPIYLTSRKVAFSNRSRAVNTGTAQHTFWREKCLKTGFYVPPPVPPKNGVFWGFWVPPPKIDKNGVFWCFLVFFWPPQKRSFFDPFFDPQNDLFIEKPVIGVKITKKDSGSTRFLSIFYQSYHKFGSILW